MNGSFPDLNMWEDYVSSLRLSLDTEDEEIVTETGPSTIFLSLER